MPHRNTINETTDEKVWEILAEQLNNKKDNKDYTARICTNNCDVTLDIDIHPDRGDEDVKPVTCFTSLLPDETGFRFNIKRQGIRQEIAKLFGMQDVIIGHEEFDKTFLIQSNDEARVKAVLSQDIVTSVFLNHPVNEFKIRERKIGTNIEIVLTLELEGGITDSKILKIIRAF